MSTPAERPVVTRRKSVQAAAAMMGREAEERAAARHEEHDEPRPDEAKRNVWQHFFHPAVG